LGVVVGRRIRWGGIEDDSREKDLQGRLSSQDGSREGRTVRLREKGRPVGDEARKREDHRRKVGRRDLLRDGRGSRVVEEAEGCSSSGKVAVEEGTGADTDRELLREGVEPGRDATSSMG